MHEAQSNDESQERQASNLKRSRHVQAVLALDMRQPERAMVYYNEVDSFAADWLEQLIKAQAIAPGKVDRRDIRDVHPNDLLGFQQHHFFAGIGGWSYALRLAGWPDDEPVWTGSCPCQPFSVAGRQAGIADERHLWPSWFHLIEQHKPHRIFGEQVEASIRHGWLDVVQDDLEALDYSVGSTSFPAASVDAPQNRQRLYFGAASCLGDTVSARLEGHAGNVTRLEEPRRFNPAQNGSTATASLRSAWIDAEWILCDDGKERAVESGSCPLDYGIPARVGRLRGYGNAINPQQAAAFITAFSEAIN